MSTINPYEPPKLTARELLDAAEPRRLPLLRVAGRWTLICVISALPSFFWGCSLHDGLLQLQAMIAGILTFVLIYTVAELSPPAQRLTQQPRVRRTLMIGYGTRLAISVIFPIGLTLDMFVGVISVSLIESRFAGDGGNLSQIAFAPVYFTTLLQGLLLNLILLGYMMVIYAVQVMTASLSRRRPLPTA